MSPGARLTESRARDDAHEIALGRGEGGRLATIISALALAFSAYSFYEAVLRSAEVAVFVPPRIEYVDPDSLQSPFEVFVVPVTVANDGAETGTVLALDLTVTNRRTGESKRFYAAQFGPWGQPARELFAPISLAGRASQSKMVQFLPRADEQVKRILDLEPGLYGFKLEMHLARSQSWLTRLLSPADRPLTFELKAPQMDYRMFQGSGTMALWAADYRPAGSASAR